MAPKIGTNKSNTIRRVVERRFGGELSVCVPPETSNGDDIIGDLEDGVPEVVF
jgi:hypothetical protein